VSSFDDDDDGVSTYKIDGLDKLIKALGATLPVVKVGILGDKNVRNGKNPSNATVGAFHEFGTENLPIRSFLRVPIGEHLQSYMVKSGALSNSTIKDVIATGSVVPWVQKIGMIAEQIVADAFNTGGFGKWKASNMDSKKNHQTLVETQQLRNSITSEVKE
jgi:hypothetical protein